MNAGELAELSGLVAVQGARLLAGPSHLSESGLRQYWSAAKQRFNCWMRVLAAGSPPSPSARESPRHARSVAPVLEEIFASELLTRVWTALVCQVDRRQAGLTAVPIVWSVLLAHLDARRRALAWLCAVPETDRPKWRAIDRMRRRSEHWTDLLLAHLLPYGEAEVRPLAFDGQRVHEFAKDLGDLHRTPHGERAWQLFQTAIKATFRTRRAPNAVWNGQIAAAVLACFPSELFDATGPLRSLWLTRLQHTTDDTLAMVEDLLAGELNCPAAACSAARSRG